MSVIWGFRIGLREGSVSKGTIQGFGVGGLGLRFPFGGSGLNQDLGVLGCRSEFSIQGAIIYSVNIDH